MCVYVCVCVRVCVHVCVNVIMIQVASDIQQDEYLSYIASYLHGLKYHISTVILKRQFDKSCNDCQINCTPLLSHLYSRHVFLSIQ